MTQDEMRARFHALGKERDAILAKSAPLKAERDKVLIERDAAQAKLRDVNGRIKEAETGLFDIDMERGAMARALNGKTGSPV